MSSEKNCPECWSKNTPEAKLCASCGHEFSISGIKKLSAFRICSKCGLFNKVSAGYCGGCGSQFAKIKQREGRIKTSKNRKGVGQKNKLKQKKASKSSQLFIFLVVVVVFYLFYQSSQSSRQPARQPATFEQFSNNPIIERDVIAVAANFVCPCGSCGELPLETCTCQTAVQERQFIRDKLQSGQNREQVIAAVNVSYGGFKPNQGLKFNPDDIKLGNPLAQLKTDRLSAQGTLSKVSSKLVTSGDLVEILTHFSCPCGQCGIPELKDCNCNHPRGATEVKIFIDQKIDEQKYTIAQVVDLVEKQYGHKIR